MRIVSFTELAMNFYALMEELEQIEATRDYNLPFGDHGQAILNPIFAMFRAWTNFIN